MDISKVEIWLEQKIKLIHRKAFVPIAYTFFGAIVLGIVVRMIGPSVPLHSLPTLNYLVVKGCLLIMCILGPLGYILAITGLKKNWVEKPQWFKDNFKL